jgi:Transglycosylase SLT domain/Domain of unknown function (DUF4124)
MVSWIFPAHRVQDIFQTAVAVTLAAAAWLCASAAHADVWGYVDAKGVAHFAAEKVDDRYELYFKGGQSFDTQDGLPGAQAKPADGAKAAAMPAQGIKTPPIAAVPPASAAASRKLVTYFEISPSFKAVKHHLREASTTHRIDMELLQALIATESGFDPLALSPKGAVGLMQLMPATAQRYGVKGDDKTPIEKKLTDPKTNIRAGSRYLGDLIKLFPGKIELAIAAYNAGEGAVQKYGNQIPPYKETQNYVKTVMQIYSTLKPPPGIAQKLAEQRADIKPPTRVKVELSGGALGRGNMVSPLAANLPTAPLAQSASSLNTEPK